MDAREHVIVCGIDGSAASRRALEWAIDEAARRDCKLRVVTAWSWDGTEAMEAASTPASELNHAREVQSAVLSQALAAADSAPEVEQVMTRGIPSEVLCTAALDAELMVLGSHGHRAVHDRLVGSTSQRVIRHASCPVVILPDPRHVERERKKAQGRRRVREAPSGSFY